MQVNVHGDDSSSEDESEAAALLRHTRGTPEEDRIDLRNSFDSAFCCWFFSAVLLSFPVLIASFYQNGVPWNMTVTRKAGAWLGTLAGMVINALGMFFFGVFVLFPDDTSSSGSSLGGSRGDGGDDCSLIRCLDKDVWIFIWAGILCQCAILYVAVHRKHIDLVEPGPSNQVWGVHGAFTAQLLLQYSNLFQPSQTAIPPEVSRYIGRNFIDETCAEINTVYRRVGVAPVCLCILVLALVFVTVLLWRVVGETEKRDFNILDAAVPFLLYLPFMAAHLVFCKITDSRLRQINANPTLVQKNVGWVMWRTASTHSYSLWLVYRNPEAYRLSRSGGYRWWHHFQAATPEFQALARAYLLANNVMFERDPQSHEVPSIRSLPTDLALEVLSFLVEGNTKRIVDARPKKFRAVMI